MAEERLGKPFLFVISPNNIYFFKKKVKPKSDLLIKKVIHRALYNLITVASFFNVPMSHGPWAKFIRIHLLRRINRIKV